MITELPKNWIETNLGTVTTKPQYGWTTKSQNFGDYKYLRTTDIGKGNIKWDEVPFCVDLPKNLDDYILSKNDIVISRAGSIGFSYLVEEIESNVLYASYLIRFKPLIYPKLISYFLQSNSYWKAVSDSAVGIAVKNINAPKLQSIPFPLPPLPEQERIVAKLDALFAQHEAMKNALKRIPQLLKDFRQQVLRQAITGRLTEKLRMEKNTHKWEEINFESIMIGTPKNGAYYPRNQYGSGTKIIRIDNFYDGKLKDWEVVQKVEIPEKDKEFYKLETDNILINRVNSIEYLGKCMLVEKIHEDAIFESNMMRIILNKNKVSPQFIKTFLVSPLGLKELKKNAKNAVNQASINQQDIKNVRINLPPLKEQQEIVSRVESLFAKADTIEKYYKTLKEKIDSLPQAILHKAFKGELVPQLPTDGDAKDLLEEILKLKKELKKK
ncbi:hypothetical protein BBI01_00845 [Chryseobacterium artocarpi]|uniref:Type I restriction modification DNA specificity domain-containing protein n=1 Tax=Chryseobacterium artocarpi TaxID=1414727 RepID=A0A1B8ZZS2_9FLAO|nr:restriction endonuclease subunit S [Chryseobacterium artocarpi]OCA77044.1 hypothetical protein BBI01_00845 [Chryseobacterium artocarpi]